MSFFKQGNWRTNMAHVVSYFAHTSHEQKGMDEFQIVHAIAYRYADRTLNFEQYYLSEAKRDEALKKLDKLCNVGE